jgi:prepilin-type N-terminal cleavage/methylation domain-containing protein/prepilin-type processing-associated H-X9-DG protein
MGLWVGFSAEQGMLDPRASAQMANLRRLAGFTLVELLVVMTIIGILVALLLPAIQAAREAARFAQCANNVKQLSLGCLNCEHVNHYFPTCGWTSAFVGDPDRGQGYRQPGGWLFAIQPYLEQGNIFDLGHGTSDAAKNVTNMERMGITSTIWYCPSRRPAIAYPYLNTAAPPGNPVPYNIAAAPATAGKTDYAANLGDNNPLINTNPPNSNVPTSLAAGDSFTNWPIGYTGITYVHSQVKVADITDGTSQTYLLGEKPMDADHYFDGADGGDNNSWDEGFDDDIIRAVANPNPVGQTPAYNYYPPLMDMPGVADYPGFGSAHANGLNMALCDGSVRVIHYTIDPEVNRRLGNRMDGLTIDAKSY